MSNAVQQKHPTVQVADQPNIHPAHNQCQSSPKAGDSISNEYYSATGLPGPSEQKMPNHL